MFDLAVPSGMPVASASSAVASARGAALARLGAELRLLLGEPPKLYRKLRREAGLSLA